MILRIESRDHGTREYHLRWADEAVMRRGDWCPGWHVVEDYSQDGDFWWHVVEAAVSCILEEGDTGNLVRDYDLDEDDPRSTLATWDLVSETVHPDSKTGILFVLDTSEQQPCYFYEQDHLVFAEPADGMYEMLERRGEEYVQNFERHVYGPPVEFGVVHVYDDLSYVFILHGDDCDAAAKRAAAEAVAREKERTEIEALSSAQL